MPEHIRIAAHADGKPRTEMLRGREHTVVPAVLVREQVLRNNLGRTFLAASEITPEWAAAWNGAPVMLDHPTRRGQPVSARDPEIENASGVGNVYRASAEDGALRADVFIDRERAADVGGLDAVLARMDKGQPGELSTGFPTDAEATEGTFNGESYDYVLHPLGADHLAVFADGEGACGLTDGCGLGVNHDGDCDVQTDDNGAGPLTRAANKISEAVERMTLAINRRGGTMTRCELQEQLAEHEDVAFGMDTLKAMSRDELLHVANGVEIDADLEPEADDGDGDDGAGERAEADAETPAWAQSLTDSVEGLTSRIDQLEADAAPARNEREAEAEKIRKQLADNAKCPFDAGDLKDKGLAELKKLARLAQPTSYVGLGGPRVSSGENALNFEVKPIMSGGRGDSALETQES